MSRRRSEQQNMESGNDSFLDILANLVGILVILVVIVGIRVKQTVKVDDDVLLAEQASSLAVEQAVEPTVIHISRDEMPISVSFAAPIAEIEADPTPSTSLALKIASLKGELAATPADPIQVVDASDLERLNAANEALSAKLAAAAEATQTAESQLTKARAYSDELTRQIGRTVARLEEDEAEEVEVISLHHDVRAIARRAGPDQLFIQLAGGRVTLLPIGELIPKVVSSAMRKYRNASSESMYSGRVGPLDGISLDYEIPLTGSSAMDDVFARASHPLSRLTFSVEVGPDAKSESMEQALKLSSDFRYALSQSVPGTTVTAFVYPDSFAEARQLQEFLQSGGVPLALHPLAFGEQIKHSSDGAASMAQ